MNAELKRNSKDVRAFRDTLRSYVSSEILRLYKGRCVWVFRSILLSFWESGRFSERSRFFSRVFHC